MALGVEPLPECVADYPQLWQRPAFAVLLACLQKLRVEPPVWSAGTSRQTIRREWENTARHRRDVASYLAGIVKSPLAWLAEDTEREALWDEASRRLSERCGRAGMGEITRRWPFACSPSTSSLGGGEGGDSNAYAYPPFELVVREPPITGDALGLKTWGSSYFLAQLLDRIAAQSLTHLLPSPRRIIAAHDHTAVDNDYGDPVLSSSSSFSSTSTSARTPPAIAEVLELGSGTGLCGMAAAAIWGTRVALSDLPEIVSNLAFNAEQNRVTIERLGGAVNAGALTWGGADPDGGDEEADHEMFVKKNQFKIILIADPLYDDNHPSLLTSAVHDHLSHDGGARVVVMVPLRDATTRCLLAEFAAGLAAGDHPLACLGEHAVSGQDDWGDDEETHRVECWWGIFGSSRGDGEPALAAL